MTEDPPNILAPAQVLLVIRGVVAEIRNYIY